MLDKNLTSETIPGPALTSLLASLNLFSFHAISFQYHSKPRETIIVFQKKNARAPFLSVKLYHRNLNSLKYFPRNLCCRETLQILAVPEGLAVRICYHC